MITAKVNCGLCVNIQGSRVQGLSPKRTETVTDEKCNRLANQRALERMLERGDNGRQGMERGKDCYWLSVP